MEKLEENQKPSSKYNSKAIDTHGIKLKKPKSFILRLHLIFLSRRSLCAICPYIRPVLSYFVFFGQLKMRKSSYISQGKGINSRHEQNEIANANPFFVKPRSR